MKIGFAGTRQGMSERQEGQLREVFGTVQVSGLHRGDCVGAYDVLVAAPPGPESEYPRSGTWATVRAAKNAGKEVIVLER